MPGDMPLLDAVHLSQFVVLLFVFLSIPEHTVFTLPKSEDDDLQLLFGKFNAFHITRSQIHNCP